METDVPQFVESKKIGLAIQVNQLIAGQFWTMESFQVMNNVTMETIFQMTAAMPMEWLNSAGDVKEKHLSVSQSVEIYFLKSKKNVKMGTLRTMTVVQSFAEKRSDGFALEFQLNANQYVETGSNFQLKNVMIQISSTMMDVLMNVWLKLMPLKLTQQFQRQILSILWLKELSCWQHQ